MAPIDVVPSFQRTLDSNIYTLNVEIYIHTVHVYFAYDEGDCGVCPCFIL